MFLVVWFGTLTFGQTQDVCVDQDFIYENISELCTYLVLPNNHVLLSREDLSLALQKNKFVPFSTGVNTPVYLRSNFLYYLNFNIVNKSPVTQDIFVKSYQTPQDAFVFEDGEIRSLAINTFYGKEDPNKILKTHFRTGFTFRMLPGKEYQFIYLISKPHMLNEAATMEVFQAQSYDQTLGQNIQFPTFLNGVFLGILIFLLIISIVTFIFLKFNYILFYIIFVSVSILYFWRDFEFWNLNFDFTHQYLSWNQGKMVIGILLFVFYTLFVYSIFETLGAENKKKEFVQAAKIIIPILLFLQFVLDRYYPFGSYTLMYLVGITSGIYQIIIIIPIMRKHWQNLTIKMVAMGSVLIFLGWCTIVVLPVDLHIYTIRVFSILEIICFGVAIVSMVKTIFEENQAAESSKQLALTKERERISGEMHDDLAGDLMAIKYLSVQAYDQNLEDYGRKSLMKINEISQRLTQTMSEIIWITDSKNESIGLTAAYVRNTAAERLAQRSIHLHYDSVIENEEIMLSGELRRDLILCVKESISNILKHSNATIVNISLTQTKDFVRIIIADNGTGINEKLFTSTGNGVQNMKTRTIRHGGAVHWSLENGVEVILSFPLTKVNSTN